MVLGAQHLHQFLELSTSTSSWSCRSSARIWCAVPKQIHGHGRIQQSNSFEVLYPFSELWTTTSSWSSGSWAPPPVLGVLGAVQEYGKVCGPHQTHGHGRIQQTNSFEVLYPFLELSISGAEHLHQFLEFSELCRNMERCAVPTRHMVMVEYNKPIVLKYYIHSIFDHQDSGMVSEAVVATREAIVAT